MNKETNNKAELAGVILSEPEYSHTVYGETFYLMDIGVARNSGTIDKIRLLISEKLFEQDDKYTGKTVRVSGEYRSFNKHENDTSRLLLFLFVNDIEETDCTCEDDVKTNSIELEGNICREPIYRKTPFGREIADLLIAVNRAHGKSDYIPCITWGRNAKSASRIEVGTRVRVEGRIQSREYVKRISETEAENRIAYEVSASRIEVIKDDE